MLIMGKMMHVWWGRVYLQNTCNFFFNFASYLNGFKKYSFKKHTYLISYISRGQKSEMCFIMGIKSRCFQYWFLLDIPGEVCFLTSLVSRDYPHSLHCGWITLTLPLSSRCLLLWLQLFLHPFYIDTYDYTGPTRLVEDYLPYLKIFHLNTSAKSFLI